MSSDKCFICEKDLSEGAVKVVKKKGIETLRDASKKRNDKKGAVLAGKTSVSVHVSCQKSYINERMIASYLKKAVELSDHLLSIFISKHIVLCVEHIFLKIMQGHNNDSLFINVIWYIKLRK